MEKKRVSLEVRLKVLKLAADLLDTDTGIPGKVYLQLRELLEMCSLGFINKQVHATEDYFYVKDREELDRLQRLLKEHITRKALLREYRRKRDHLFNMTLDALPNPFTISMFKKVAMELSEGDLPSTPSFEEERRPFSTKGGYSCLAFDRVLKYLLRKIQNHSMWMRKWERSPTTGCYGYCYYKYPRSLEERRKNLPKEDYSKLTLDDAL